MSVMGLEKNNRYFAIVKKEEGADGHIPKEGEIIVDAISRGEEEW
jgi:hypothetical protein